MKPQEAIGIMKIALAEVEWEYPMARKKKLFPCNEKCKQCIAGIIVDEEGYREHVTIKGEKR